MVELMHMVPQHYPILSLSSYIVLKNLLKVLATPSIKLLYSVLLMPHQFIDYKSFV